jgi:hypothetical protein
MTMCRVRSSARVAPISGASSLRLLVIITTNPRLRQRIQTLIEMRRTDVALRIVGAHAAAAVEQYDHILIPLVLELADDPQAPAVHEGPLPAPH